MQSVDGQTNSRLYAEDFETSNTISHDFSATSNFKYRQVPLSNFIIYDPGSTCHIINNKSRFLDLHPYDGELLVGDTKTNIEGLGTAWTFVTKPEGLEKTLEVVRDVLCSQVPYQHHFLVALSKERLLSG